MNRDDLSPLQRIALAFAAFFLVLFRRDFALRVAQVRAEQKALPAPPRPGAPPGRPHVVEIPTVPRPPPRAPEPAPAAERTAVQLLSLLQREGRLVDFVEENLADFSDSQVGAAARLVHEGCRRVISEHFTLEPVYREPEGAPVIVGPNFDPSSVRLSGNVVGNPPFRGSLRHHGWKARGVKLPALTEQHDPAIVAPAEVEL